MTTNKKDGAQKTSTRTPRAAAPHAAKKLSPQGKQINMYATMGKFDTTFLDEVAKRDKAIALVNQIAGSRDAIALQNMQENVWQMAAEHEDWASLPAHADYVWLMLRLHELMGVMPQLYTVLKINTEA